MLSPPGLKQLGIHVDLRTYVGSSSWLVHAFYTKDEGTARPTDPYLVDPVLRMPIFR